MEASPQLDARATRHRIDSVQALRGFAAIAVVAVHTVGRLQQDLADSAGDSLIVSAADLRHVGQAGVDLFFVISGFIMLYTRYNDFQKPGAPTEFFIKRLLRIVPIYWALTTLALMIFVVLTHPQSADVLWIAGSYLFIPIQDTPVLTVGWTLNFEMYFYALFALALFLPRRSAILGMVLWFVASVIVGVLLQPTDAWTNLLTSWHLLKFLTGLLIAHGVQSGLLSLDRRAGLIALAIGVACILATAARVPDEGWQRFVFWGLPSGAILYGALTLKAKAGTDRPWLLFLMGDASYSIYLSQAFTVPILSLGFAVIGLQQFVPFDLLALLLITLCTALGIACWYFCERPLTLLAAPVPRALTSARPR